MFKKMSCSMIVVILMLLVPVYALADAPDDYVDEVNVERIDFLFDERARMLSKNDMQTVNEIDRMLADLGVKSMTDKEIAEKIYSVGDVIPYAAVPSSKSVTWSSTRVKYSYAGVNYEIQTITAQPLANSSILRNSKVVSVSSPKSGKAGAMLFLKSLWFSSLSGIVQEMQAGSIALSLFDAFRSTVSGLQSTTVVDSISATYHFNDITTVNFKFIKKIGQSDSFQYMSHISSKYNHRVHVYVPEIVVNNGIVTAREKTLDRSTEFVPSGYNSNYDAIRSYVSGSSMLKTCVNRVNVTGLSGKALINLYPACPNSMGQIY